MRIRPKRVFLKSFVIFVLLCGPILILAQSGNRPHANAAGGVMVGVVARRDDNKTNPITSKEVSVYDNGIEQSIRNFTPDPSPARIALLVDNSLTIRADVDKLEQAAREFAYEIFEGDKLLIVGYDEQAEIVTDWTDNANFVAAPLVTTQYGVKVRCSTELACTGSNATAKKITVACPGGPFPATITVNRAGTMASQLVSIDWSPPNVSVDIIRGTLTGNRAALEKNYYMHLAGTQEKWVLTLLPSEQKIAALVLRIVVSGSKNQIRSIEYLQADGDRSVMSIEPIDGK